MPTKVLCYDVMDVINSFGEHPGYDYVTLLLRSEGVPVGKLDVKLRDGKANLGELAEVISQRVWWPVIDLALRPHPPFAPVLERASVVICTRERPDDLRRCLASLLAMPDDGQEVIVVDNNPKTSATRELVAQFPGVLYLREDQPGANSARNRGIQAAQGGLIAFIDDDAVADSNWLRGILSPFRDPQVQCVTGLTVALELETVAQEYFERAFGFSRRGLLPRKYRSPPHNPLLVGGVGASVNMAIRRSLTDRIGLLDPALGPGTPTMSGDDHEYFTRILRAGHTIVYEPAALNWHRHRRTWGDLRHVMFAYGVGSYASWTRSLVVEKEWQVLLHMFNWFRYDQGPALYRAWRRKPGALPLDLVKAELRGCLLGPWRYLQARKKFPKYQIAS